MLQRAGGFKRIKVKEVNSLKPYHTDTKNLLLLDWPRLSSVFQKLLFCSLCTDGGVLGLAREGRTLGRAPAQARFFLFSERDWPGKRKKKSKQTDPFLLPHLLSPNSLVLIALD